VNTACTSVEIPAAPRPTDHRDGRTVNADLADYGVAAAAQPS
jgi:hypothetical protein